MKLPKVKNTELYNGLYVVDFGQHTSIGFTAGEIELLLESEKFNDIKVYKIYNAMPDGQMELKGVPNSMFNAEMGMFFYSHDIDTAKNNYKKLLSIAISSTPPAKAKIHLAEYDNNKFVTALIYPAEANDEFSKWLLDANYKTCGEVIGGGSAVLEYYKNKPNVLEHHQLFGNEIVESRNSNKLLEEIHNPIQRFAC